MVINEVRIEKALILMLEDWLESANGRDSWFRGKEGVVVGEEEEEGSKSGRMSRALNAELRGPTLKEVFGDEWAVPWALLGHRGLGDFFLHDFPDYL